MHLRTTAALWAGRISSRLPVGLNNKLWRTLRLAKPSPIFRLTGKTRGGETGTMIIAGNGPIMAYAPGLFFAEEPRAQLISRVSIVRLPAELRRLRASADITVVRVDRLIAGPLFGNDYLRLPEWVRSSMPVPGVSTNLGQNSGSLRQDLRLVRKHRFKPVESHDEGDLRRFYDTMFYPHTVGRHRTTHYLKSFEEVRSAWRTGCLVWVDADGQQVAGLVVSVRARSLLFVGLGTRQGDESLLRKGVLSAAYRFGIEYAQRRNLDVIDFGATRPSLNDNLLRYKRKWGATLDPREAGQELLLSYWPITTPAIAAMLAANPLVFSQNGSVCAVTAESAILPTPEERKGLRALYLAQMGKPWNEFRLAPATLESCVSAHASESAEQLV